MLRQSQRSPLQENSVFSTQESTNLIFMNKEFFAEDTSYYLNDNSERAPYIADIRNGRLQNRLSEKTYGKTSLLYVLDRQNALYVVPESLKWNHSYFLAGGPVKAAGFIHTDENGTITSISNESGHYTPTLLQMLPALQFFYAACVIDDNDEDDIQYESHDKAKTDNLISLYHLSDIVRNITSPKKLKKLPGFVIAEYSNTRTNSETVISGYNTELGDNVTSSQSFSRYGLAPVIKNRL